MSAKLYQPATIGDFTIANNVIMAPLTRTRSDPTHHAANDLMTEYYVQRATAGLIISEAVMVTPNTSAFYAEPGLYEDAQIAGWRKLTDAVHAAGGKIVAQLWHGGSVCPQAYSGVPPPAPSHVQLEGTFHNCVAGGARCPYDAVTHTLTDAEVQQLVKDFAAAASRAIAAGFDGIEIHAANGYLINQFLVSTMNKRDDSSQYSGRSIQTRARFMLEVVDACVDAIGKGKVGVRLSPYVHFNSAKWDDPAAEIPFVAAELDKRGVAFLHILRRNSHGTEDVDGVDCTALFREHYKSGYLMTNVAFEREEAEAVVEAGTADGVAFGILYIANPDLVERFKRRSAERNPVVVSALYAGDEKGFTDYPALQNQ